MAEKKIETEDIPEALELEEAESPESPSSDGKSHGLLAVSVNKFSKMHDPIMTSIFPVLILDGNLKIIYANSVCEGLFPGFSGLAGRYFIDIFGKYFAMEDIRSIRETIVKGKNGYSWKGETQFKFQDMVTRETRVYVFPAEMNARQPSEFVVIFDDVTEENRRLLRAVFLSLLEASKLKDNDTGKHITRVNYYSQRLAKQIFDSLGKQYPKVDADFVDNIVFLASMHDVGKIGTPDDILNKEGPLSDWEWTVMREHTKNGAFILSTYPNPMAKEIALAHHERWDGSGYPFQLVGEMIPLSARIVAIADVYDALRMERSYKPALSHEVAVAKMVEEKGTHFDPYLMNVFSIIAGDFNKIYEDNKDTH
ncbi:MAG: HD domain-containing protein [Treponema sp.]|jgi:putative two-component system response regulator|nr:HD domain-containing protein [Treponema sp.]